MRKVKIGAPGYILMKDMSLDMLGTLKKIADIGYDGIEITGFFGHGAAEIRRMCGLAGLEPYGCFVHLTTLLGEETHNKGGNWEAFANAFAIPGQTPEEVMRYIQEIGCRYVGLLIPNAVMDSAVTDRINRAAALARRHGLRLQYHNHDYEYTNMVNGQYRMDFIMENTVPELLFEPDLGWMEIGGYPAQKALQKYPDRIEVIHLKDYYRENNDPSESFRFRPTGYGVMDWARLLPLCEKLVKPAWYAADHDNAYDGDIYEELRLSLDYIRKMLEYCP